MSTKVKAKCVANHVVIKLAVEAIEVQDACNLIAVAKAFARAMSTLRQEHQSAGTAWTNQHPITRMWVDKLSHLARLEQDPRHEHVHRTHDLAEGRDIEFECEA